MSNEKEELVEVVKEGKGLGLRFINNDLAVRKIRLEPSDRIGQALEEGDRWWATITSTEENEAGEKSPVIVRLIRKINRPDLSRIVTEIPGFYLDPQVLRMVQILLLAGKHVMLVGHKGTGKTELAQLLSAAWDCPFHLEDCGNLQHPGALFGSEAAKDGSTLWVPSAFFTFMQRALAEPTQLFLLCLDELNRTSAKNSESFHGLYGPRRQTSFTTSEGTKTLVMPANVLTLATRNFGHQYTGTFALDAALSDRFVPFQMLYITWEQERDLLMRKYGLHEVQATTIAKVARALRRGERTGILSASPSPRRTDATALLVMSGIPVKTAIEFTLFGDFDPGMAGLEEEGEENALSGGESELLQARSIVKRFIEEVIAEK